MKKYITLLLGFITVDHCFGQEKQEDPLMLALARRFVFEYQLAPDVIKKQVDRMSMETIGQTCRQVGVKTSDLAGCLLDIREISGYSSDVLINMLINYSSDKYTSTVFGEKYNLHHIPSQSGKAKLIKAKRLDFLYLPNLSVESCKFASNLNINKFTVVDLRSNFGGSLECAKSILRNFHPTNKKFLISTLVMNEKVKDITAIGTGPQKTRGAVIVNQNTASSAELIARNLMILGYDIYGEESYGKNTVQSYYQMSSTPSYIITVGELRDSLCQELGCKIRPKAKYKLSNVLRDADVGSVQ